jgi:putative membrane protein
MDKAAETSMPALIDGDPSTELSSNRTSLSFERTRMSADRTLMSIVRTSLSLISFGFTINQVFSKASTLIPKADQSGRNLGLALLLLGVALLATGIYSHNKFDHELTDRRERLHGMKLLRRAVQYRATPTYVTALGLLIVGIGATGIVIFRLL